MADVTARPLPLVTPLTAPFWASGADGRLRFVRCRDCGYYTHPPGPRCASCLSQHVAFEPVSGRGTVHACTVNRHTWSAGWDVPYVVAVVELDEQPDLRLLSNVIGCAPDAVHIGQRVRVTFQHQDDIWLPLFEPDGAEPCHA